MQVNNVVVAGKIRQEKYSHNAHCLDFREIILECKRNSGTKDLIKVIYQEEAKRFCEGERIIVSGSLRSRRAGNKLEIYLYAEEIDQHNGEDINELIIEGYICSKPYFKKVVNRKLTQFLICVENKRKSYVSVLIWKKMALKCGDKVTICGRLQSRSYKQGDQERSINEISVYKIN